MVDLSELRVRMQKAVDLLQEELSQVKAGRASPSLVEKIMVEAYDTQMSLVELASITTPDPNQLLVSPFDKSIIGEIQRAIGSRQELGLSASVDGEVVRIIIPPLTEERRQELIKVIGQKLEITRVMVRQERGELMAQIRRSAEAKELNEDEKFEMEKKVQDLTDEFNEKIGSIGKQKEQELLSL